jgi:hypothetical protein
MSGEVLERTGQALFVEQLEHRGAFAAGYDEAVALGQVGGRPHFNGMTACAFYRLPMGLEIALKSENTGSFRVAALG